jgi:glycosyltransferase involved in cell wall biosynthesis
MKILFVTLGLPYPPDSGVRIRDFYLIKNISLHHSVLLLSLIPDSEQVKDLQKLKPYCDLIDFVLARRRSIMEHFRGIVFGFFNGRPLATHPFIYDEMLSKIHEVVANWDVDIVQIEHSFLASYLEAIPSKSKCKKILSFHNLGVSQYKRMINLKNGISGRFLFLVKWMLMLRWEARYAGKFDRCLVVSPLECQLLKSESPNLPISVIENGVDTELYHTLAETSDGNTMIFVGTMAYPPILTQFFIFTKL